MTVEVEVVVGRGVGGGELPQGPDVPEASHGALSSSERLVGILGSIVEPATAELAAFNTDFFHRRTVGAQAVGHCFLGPAVALHRTLEKRQHRPRHHPGRLHARTGAQDSFLTVNA